MKTRNGMQAIRARTVTMLKVAAVAAVLSFGSSLVGVTAPVSAQVFPWPEKVIQIGPIKFCLLICWHPGYCCTWLGGQL